MGIEPGTVIAKRYRVLQPLGKGGMGEVFSAENSRTGRQVALKVLRAESKAKASAIERFRREARAAGSIRSDYVTQVLDVEDDPEHGIVLVFELLEGESLVDRLKRTGPIAFAELWPIVEAVWMGLSDAHAAGVVHRDLKPSNVYLIHPQGGRPGRVKILDFGISKLPKQITTQSLTQVGQSLGTFSFMPPEQIGKAKSVDHRADIYACTTLIYQALSGQLPYVAKNVVAMMELKARTEPRSLSEAMGHSVDPRLETFIARGLARDPERRFQSADEALEWWRRLRPANVQSIVDADAPSNVDDEEEEESSRAKTTVRDVKGWMRSPGAAGAGGDGAATRRYVMAGDAVVPAPSTATTRRDAAAASVEMLSGSDLQSYPSGALPAPVRASPTASGPESTTLPMRRTAGASYAYPPSPRTEGADALGGYDAHRAEQATLRATGGGFGPPAHAGLAATSDPRSSYYGHGAAGAQASLDDEHGRPPSRLRVALALVLGAIGLMLIGFGIVAIAMQLLQ